MLEPLEKIILSALQTIFDQFGWWGVFGLMIFENATGITPSEIILAFAGWMLIDAHGIAPSFIPLAGLYASLGSAIGASIPYWIARAGGRPLVDKFASFFRIDLAYIDRMEKQCSKWGAGIVLFGRLIPGLRTLVNIPAGLLRIPFHKFFIATFAGAYIWCTVLIGAGYMLGHEWKSISGFVMTNLPLVIIPGILLAGACLMYYYRASITIPGWRRQSSKELD
ncbi:MAG TPA: DedA family protein [Anaerolineales bacterium]|nr:DedA family protein [Anaerolineales bacterium]